MLDSGMPCPCKREVDKLIWVKSLPGTGVHSHLAQQYKSNLFLMLCDV